MSRLNTALLSLSLLALLAGLGLVLYGRPALADQVWLLGVVPVLAALIVEIARSLWQGDVGLDLVAALSMTAAVWFGETLAAAVVAVMYSGGTFLESYAEGRASRDMRDLLSRVPRTALRHRNGALDEVPIDAIAPGDLLLIRQGDVAPADGTLASARATVDMSALTGEAMPVGRIRGDEVLSGATNAGEAYDLTVTRPAADSTYAGIIRLVAAAQAAKSPMARMADRYSIVFLVVTVALAGAAWWMTGDPIRAVAVLVVATPCPLILAVPVALVAGLSRAARFGVLIKGGGALETMARVRTLILDKTGTLTDGRPVIVDIHADDGFAAGDILFLAATLDQASKHPIAQALVAAARAAGHVLPVPDHLTEFPGEGVTGQVAGRSVIVGGAGFVAGRVGVPSRADAVPPGAVVVALAVDGRMAGQIVMADVLRGGMANLLIALRGQGVARILLSTGDRPDVAAAISADLGLDGVHAEMTPDGKRHLIDAERQDGVVMMVGDGVNDAPALAAADIGVAMGARGAAASAEAADVVILLDQLSPLLPGLSIARGARAIALQCIYVGIGLSVLGMIAAALGYLTPVQGAVLQEVIDVSVILNALRVLQIRPATVSA